MRREIFFQEDILKMSPKDFIHPLYNFIQQIFGRVNALLGGFFLFSPVVLRLRITNNCDLTCNFCFLKSGLNRSEINHLSIEEWKKIVEKLPRRTIVDIAGNEPLLAKNFKEIFALFLEKGFRVSLITNGMSWDDELIELIVSKKLNFLMVSLDGMEEIHNKVRGDKKSFQKAIEFIERINIEKEKRGSKKPGLCIKSVLLEDNGDDLKNLQDYAFNELGAGQHTINLLFQNKGRGGSEFFKTFKELEENSGNTHRYNQANFKKLFMALKELASRRNVNVKPPMKPSLWKSYLTDPSRLGVERCFKSYSVLTLYFNGLISPCDLAYEIGNIRETDYDLKRVWKTKRFSAFWKNFKDSNGYVKACEGCNLSTQTWNHLTWHDNSN